MNLPKLETTPLDYGDIEVWSDEALRLHAQVMMAEQSTALPRKAGELERKVNHAIFELAMRNQDMKQTEVEVTEMAA